MLVIVVLVVSDKPHHHCTQLKDMGSLNTIVSGESDGLDNVLGYKGKSGHTQNWLGLDLPCRTG